MKKKQLRVVGFRRPLPEEDASSNAPLTSDEMPHEIARNARRVERFARLRFLRTRGWQNLTVAEKDEAYEIMFDPTGPDTEPVVPKIRSPHPPGVTRAPEPK